MSARVWMEDREQLLEPFSQSSCRDSLYAPSPQNEVQLSQWPGSQQFHMLLDEEAGKNMKKYFLLAETTSLFVRKKGEWMETHAKYSSWLFKSPLCWKKITSNHQTGLHNSTAIPYFSVNWIHLKLSAHLAITKFPLQRATAYLTYISIKNARFPAALPVRHIYTNTLPNSCV